MPLPLQHFYMIRHGETEANAARIMAGSLDSPLTEKGVQQARDTIEIIQSLTIKPTKIFHSNLRRARNTAAILNEALNCDMHETTYLAEWHAGDWEGVPYDDCPEFLEDWVNPPGGETAQEFLNRVQQGKRTALTHTPAPVLIVCHGGLFRAFGKFYDINSYGVDNCTLYEFTPDPSKTQFPWEVHKYMNRKRITREPAVIYSGLETIGSYEDAISS